MIIEQQRKDKVSIFSVSWSDQSAEHTESDQKAKKCLVRTNSRVSLATWQKHGRPEINSVFVSGGDRFLLSHLPASSQRCSAASDRETIQTFLLWMDTLALAYFLLFDSLAGSKMYD